AKLVEDMVRAGCPSGGIIIDPFAGLGTTGLVANALGRRAVLIEVSPQYAAMTEQRIRDELPRYAAELRAREAEKTPVQEAADNNVIVQIDEAKIRSLTERLRARND